MFFIVEIEDVLLHLRFVFKDICQNVYSEVFNDSVVIENDIPDTISTVRGLQKVSDQRNTDRQETYKLRPYI